MPRDVDLPGAAHLVLTRGVVQLDPKPAMFEAMLEGWSRQQQSRFLRASSICSRLALIRRFVLFSGQYPWQWTPAELEAFMVELLSGEHPLAHSTLRNYQTTVRQFCEFITDARYGWAPRCEEQFGESPVQICHEWNTVAHLVEYEGKPGRRALTYDEVDALFAAADDRVGLIRARHRKGSLAAMRDAAMLKVVYAYGLRRQEAASLDLVDFHLNPRVPSYGRFGSVNVRFGKATRGSAPKRRTVLTVPEMDWVTDVLAQWFDELRPMFSPGEHRALWVTERRGRASMRLFNDVFTEIRDAAGLARELDLHSLRHSYVTHLIEFGYPPLFVQQQVGHVFASTTALYTSVSDEFRNRLMEQSLSRVPELNEVAP